jgi:AraC-like DNA-binding protein
MRVALLFGSRHDRLRFASALEGSATVVAADDVSGAWPLLEQPETRACIVCVHAPAAPLAIGAIRELRQAFPALPIVAYCDVHELDRQDLIGTIRAGATDLIFRGIDDGATVARHVLAQAVRHSHADELLRLLAPTLAPALLVFVRFGLQHPAAASDLDMTAAALGMARRTLTKRLQLLEAPPPRRLFTWTRLLLAGSLLSEPGRSAQSVALELELESGGALRQLLRRYADVALSAGGSRRQLRSVLVDAFLADLTSAASKSSSSDSPVSSSSPDTRSAARR